MRSPMDNRTVQAEARARGRYWYCWSTKCQDSLEPPDLKFPGTFAYGKSKQAALLHLKNAILRRALKRSWAVRRFPFYTATLFSKKLINTEWRCPSWPAIQAYGQLYEHSHYLCLPREVWAPWGFWLCKSCVVGPNSATARTRTSDSASRNHQKT